MKLLKKEAISTDLELILFLSRELAVPSVSITNMISHDFHLQYYLGVSRKEVKHTISTQFFKHFILLLEKNILVSKYFS